MQRVKFWSGFERPARVGGHLKCAIDRRQSAQDPRVCDYSCRAGAMIQPSDAECPRRWRHARLFGRLSSPAHSPREQSLNRDPLPVLGFRKFRPSFDCVFTGGHVKRRVKAKARHILAPWAATRTRTSLHNLIAQPALIEACGQCSRTETALKFSRSFRGFHARSPLQSVVCYEMVQPACLTLCQRPCGGRARGCRSPVRWPFSGSL